MRSFFAIALLCAMPSLAFAAVQVSASPAATECVPRLRAARAELHAKDIATLSVRFERNGGVFSALVQGDNYERRIMDRQCDALARAVAIMLATVEDAEAPQPAPASAPAPQPVAVGVIETPPPAPIAPRARVSLSAGAALSIFASPAGGVRADLTIAFAPPIAIELGFLWTGRFDQPLGTGALSTWTALATASVCYEPLRRTYFELGICANGMVGALNGSASGFSANAQATKPWVALGAMATVRGKIAGSLGWNARLTGAFPVTRSGFSIDGLGVVHADPVLGAVLSTGLHVSFL